MRSSTLMDPRCLPHSLQAKNLDSLARMWSLEASVSFAKTRTCSKCQCLQESSQHQSYFVRLQNTWVRSWYLQSMTSLPIPSMLHTKRECEKTSLPTCGTQAEMFVTSLKLILWSSEEFYENKSSIKEREESVAKCGCRVFAHAPPLQSCSCLSPHPMWNLLGPTLEKWKRHDSKHCCAKNNGDLFLFFGHPLMTPSLKKNEFSCWWPTQFLISNCSRLILVWCSKLPPVWMDRPP